MTKPKIYIADEIWAGREYSPVEVPMGTEFVSKQDYDELEGRLTKSELENKRITELESDLAYVRKTAEIQLKLISDMDKNLAKAKAERDELKRRFDSAPKVWIIEYEEGEYDDTYYSSLENARAIIKEGHADLVKYHQITLVKIGE